MPACDFRYMLLAAKDGDVQRLTRSCFSLNPLDTRDLYNDTPLHHAAVRGHLESCKLLLQVEPGLVMAVNNGKNTPLHLASSTAKHDVVQVLLNAGAAVNARGIESFTPLHYACRDVPKVVGSDPEDRPGAHQVQASVAVVELLLKRGANPDARTADGSLPQDLAWCDEVRALLPHAHVAATRLQYHRRLRELLQLGEAPADGADTEGEAARLVDSLLPDLPPKLLCPITHCPLIDPVETVDGHTYERYAITQWLEEHPTSPLTGLPLASKQLAPNDELRDAVEQELRRRGGAADRMQC